MLNHWPLKSYIWLPFEHTAISSEIVEHTSTEMIPTLWHVPLSEATSTLWVLMLQFVLYIELILET